MQLLLKISLVLLVFCLSCKQQIANPAAFFWNDTLSLTKADSTFLAQQKINRLYIRFFEVAWNYDTAVPENPLQADYNAKHPKAEVIPTIVIQNEVFLQLAKQDTSALGDLASKITQKIDAQTSYLGIYDKSNKGYQGYMPQTDLYIGTEMQFHCNWTPQSKAAYFAFLTKFKALHPKKQISVSLNSDAFSNPESYGIPPVNSAMLLLHQQETPTVASFNTALPKFSHQTPYPLSLGFALPIFTQTAVFRNGRFVENVPIFSQKNQHQNFLKKNGETLVVTKEAWFQNVFLEKGDVIKTRTFSPQTAKAFSKEIRKLIQNSPFQVALFHFNPSNLTPYTDEDFSKIFEPLR